MSELTARLALWLTATLLVHLLPTPLCLLGLLPWAIGMRRLTKPTR